MTLIELASLFEERKSWIVTASALDKDALHIYFGMALFVVVRLIWRWRGGWLVAWLAVLAMACGGEWLDSTAERSHAVVRPDPEHWHDIWNTMFWPTVLLLIGRWLQPAATQTCETEAPIAVSDESAERSLEQA